MDLKIQIAAKTNVGLVRTNNEDNFTVAADLSKPEWKWTNNEIIDLGSKGTLLVVADGMGGMNAGEVASEIAINTVKDYFTPERIMPEVTAGAESIEQFMNQCIVQADERVKEFGASHPDSNGLGTTIVIAWILDGLLYVSWCGDSRAYVYSPEAGLHQISKDHSYVQSLVDEGKITHEDTFDYPDSNIITRSLCDRTPPAEPDALFKPYPLSDGDIVMLCSDGLSGMIRDHATEEIISKNPTDMDKLADQLIEGAFGGGGADNVTVVLCRVVEGGAPSDVAYFTASDAYLHGKTLSPSQSTVLTTKAPSKGNTKKWLLYALLAIVAALACIFCLVMFSSSDNSDAIAQPAHTPSTSIAPDDEPTQAPVPQKAQQAKPEKPAKTQSAAKPDKAQKPETDDQAANPEPAATEADEATAASQPQSNKQPVNSSSAINAITNSSNTATPATNTTTILPQVQQTVTNANDKNKKPSKTDVAPQTTPNK